MNNNNENRLTEEQIVSVLDDKTKEEFNELLKMRGKLEKEFDELMERADVIGRKLDAIDDIIDSTIEAVEEAIREEKTAEQEKAKAQQAKRDMKGAYPVIMTDGKVAVAAHIFIDDDKGIYAITNAQEGYIDTDAIAFFFVEEKHCNQEVADDFMETVSHSKYDALTLANAMMDVQLDAVDTAERMVRRALEH